MTTHEEFLDRAALAALRVLDAAEEAELRAHIEGCSGCREAARGFEEAAGALPWALDAAEPPAGMKARVLARVVGETPAAAAAPAVAATPPRLTLVHDAGARPPAREPHVWRAAVVALATGLLASLALNVWLYGQVGSLSGQLTVLVDDKTSLETRLIGMQQQAEARAAQLAVLQARDTRMAKIPGQPMAKGASAMVFWSQEEQAWLVAASGLPQAEAGKTYQLWAVGKGGEKVSMGTFEVGPDGGAVVRATLRPDMKPAAAAVSLEPAGGMPQPTGPIVMLGELKI